MFSFETLWNSPLLIVLLGACGVCLSSLSSKSEPVPDNKEAPAIPDDYYDLPVITATKGPNGDVINLSNYAMSAGLLIDKDRHIHLTGIRTKKGKELLKEPSCAFQIVSSDGKVIKDASTFTVERWHTWRSGLYVELEAMLEEPVTLERATWYVRLYKDKPYLEQRFDLPNLWRIKDRALIQTLHTSDSLRPVMPVNVLKLGFIKGAANLKERNRFEFVEKCEHLVYDPSSKAGLSGFLAGAGGEERMVAGEVTMFDHATPALAGDDPMGKIVLFPFDGAVEKGFLLLRRFISDEYACQGSRYPEYSWNQFWLWQGGYMDWGYQELTAERLLDILPHIKAMGVEQLHLDAGWEEGMNRAGRNEDTDWKFDPVRFPDGFEPIRSFLRANGMGYITHINQEIKDNPQVLNRIIDETDLDKLFIDDTANEDTLACLRKVRKRHPDFQVFSHSMSDARRETSYWYWGNMHYLLDFDQVYFGEGNWRPYLKDLPPNIPIKRFVDLYTRCAAYQADWVWPYKCIHPPHAGYTLAGQEFRNDPDWTSKYGFIPEPPFQREDVVSLVLTTIAARYNYSWGDDPRLMKPDTLKLFLDWTAFWKVFREYLNEYQHILPVPDGIHPDGVAHMKDGEGFIVLFNPGTDAASVDWKDILWEPELELDPRKTISVSDWTDPLSSKKLESVNVGDPKGSISIDPMGFRVICIDIDVESRLKDVKQERSMMNWPPKASG